MFKFKYRYFLCAFIVLFSLDCFAETNLRSFSAVDNENLTSREDYTNEIREIILTQPEFKEALAKKNEFSQDRKFASRNRFPTIVGQIVNDRSISRDIRNSDALRKVRDDSFDGVIGIDQPIYRGNEIRSKIKIADIEINRSSIELNQITSQLILTASEIYVDAVISRLLSDYSNQMLLELEKYRELSKKRFNAGVAETSEMAIINVRLSEIAAKNALLEAKKIETSSLFRAFFNKESDNLGLPNIELNEINDFNQNNISQKEYNLEIARTRVDSQEAELEVVKSQYRPQLGFGIRYTMYDIDDQAEDTDIRGGFYLNFPIFNFGRGSAQVGSAKARLNQARIELDKTYRDVKYVNAQNYGSSSGSLRARNQILDSYENVKLQRETFALRIGNTDFSIPTLLEAAFREINLYEQLIYNERELFLSDLRISHMNALLLNRFYINLKSR